MFHRSLKTFPTAFTDSESASNIFSISNLPLVKLFSSLLEVFLDLRLVTFRDTRRLRERAKEAT